MSSRMRLVWIHVRGLMLILRKIIRIQTLEQVLRRGKEHVQEKSNDSLPPKYRHVRVRRFSVVIKV